MGTFQVRFSKNVFNLSFPCVQIEKILSIHPNHIKYLLILDETGFKLVHKNTCITWQTFRFYRSTRYLFLSVPLSSK